MMSPALARFSEGMMRAFPGDGGHGNNIPPFFPREASYARRWAASLFQDQKWLTGVFIAPTPLPSSALGHSGSLSPGLRLPWGI